MWPVVDHTHIFSDLSLPGDNGGRAVPRALLPAEQRYWELAREGCTGARGPFTSWRAWAAWEGGSLTQQSKSLARKVQCHLLARVQSHPGHQRLWFSLLFPLKVCLVTHTRPTRGAVAAHSCSQELSVEGSVRPAAWGMFFPWVFPLPAKMVLWGRQG